jgi:short subunit dehydrogenase-like uncharacterized protein
MSSNKPLSLPEKQKLKNKPQKKQFAIFYLLILPIWLVILLPLTIIYMLITKLLKILGIKKEKIPKSPSEIDSSSLEATKVSKENREFDIVVYGATGFTGGFMCEYLAKNYEFMLGKLSETRKDKQIRWAIAGRSPKKLQALKESLKKLNPKLKDLPTLIVDSKNLKQVWDMCGRTKVVVTMVGPFAVYGNNVVHSCVQNGTDYCDITGEINWVRYNIDKYREQALRTGSRLIFSAGCDSVPWDVATFILNQKVKEDPEDEMCKVEHLNDLKISISGGTLSTILNMVDGKYTCPIKPRPSYDPLVTAYTDEFGYQKSNSKLVIRNPIGVGRVSKSDSRWRAMSPLAGGNSRIVSISQAQLGYANKLVYSEYIAENVFFNVMNYIFGLILLVTCVLLKPLRHFMLKNSLLPNPGQGPTLAQRKLHYAVIESTAFTKKGKKVVLHSRYNEDIGYVDTARMLVESGLCFIFNEDGVVQRGGLYSPAACLKNELRKRLEATGTEFEFM